MDLAFTVSARIARHLHDVFEAVADPARLSAYFTTGGAQGRLEPGATVTWDFHDFPGAFPVLVLDVVPDQRIVLRWAANEPDSPPYDTTVTMTFAGLEDGRTLVTIAEEGWHETPAGLAASYGNCAGWMHMLCAMKAFLEHGIVLRQGMFA